jgi:hypothetical protein
MVVMLCAARRVSAQDPTTPPPPGRAAWSVHAQLTYQLQAHGTFPAPYAGTNSFLNRDESRGSFTTTLYAGHRLWRGAEAYADIEAFAGSGLSKVLGLAGPPNGETYRVDSTQLKAGLARLLVRQTWDLEPPTVAVQEDANQLAGRVAPRRVVLTVGKVSGTDIFDGNTYSHDPRTQFNNWSLWADGAWDYPADTRGYTWGVATEWYHATWVLRAGTFLEPIAANELQLDHDVRHAHGSVVEVEHDHRWQERPGAVRVLLFDNRARMGVYRDALAANPSAPDVTSTRAPGRRKYGGGINAEQQLADGIGAFLRVGWNDGRTESWAFTEIERTASGGLSFGGGRWHRPNDSLGLAFAVNGLGRDHRDYFAAGGYGFMLGDGRLQYAAERLLDGYYSLALLKGVFVSVEAQRFASLAMNADRGPVTVYGVRLHVEH